MTDDEERSLFLRWLAATAICVSDWGIAASHMAFDTIVFKPAFAAEMPIWGDVWHYAASHRYISMALLAALVFGWRLRWYAATAFANWAGWQLLKHASDKTQWGWGVWERWI